MKILLTGDDGYKSIGVRIMAAVLKEKGFQVVIAATKEERSSTGGSFPGNGTWGKDTVEGTEALWVDSMPADAVELASNLYGKDFDLVVSGINMGANISLIPASGTIGAALHGLDRGLAPKALAFSWMVPHKMEDRAGVEKSVAEFEDHPKKAVRRLIDLAFENNFWQAGFLNFNIPILAPSALRICAPMEQPYERFYGYSQEIDSQAHTYKKISGEAKTLSGHLEYDGYALSQGYATVIPWLANRYVNEDILKLIGTEIQL